MVVAGVACATESASVNAVLVLLIVAGLAKLISVLFSTDAIFSVPPKTPTPNPRPTSPDTLPAI